MSDGSRFGTLTVILVSDFSFSFSPSLVVIDFQARALKRVEGGGGEMGMVMVIYKRDVRLIDGPSLEVCRGAVKPSCSC